MSSKTFLYGVFACLMLAWCALTLAEEPLQVLPEDVGMSSERLSRLDIYINKQIKNREFSGATMIIGRRGEVIYKKAFGLADIEENKPMRTDTMFRLCSSSKMIAAVAGMILWEEGLFDLLDPVSKYLPEVKDLTVVEYDLNDPGNYEVVPAKTPLLVHHGFNFTSGLTYIGFNPVIDDFLRGSPADQNGFYPYDFDSIEYLNERAKLPLLNHPGEQFNYGRDLQIVAALVEKLTGKSFNDFLKERIFDKLQMNDTHFFVPEEKMNRVTSLYLRDGDQLIKAEEGKTYKDDKYGIAIELDPYWFRASKNPQKFAAAGEGLVSTVEDYARFLQMMANGGKLNDSRILSPKTIEFMMANHIEGLECCYQNMAVGMGGYGWGLGTSVLLNNSGGSIGTPMGIGKGGQYTWGGWMGTIEYVDPEEELFFTFMSQKLPLLQQPTGKIKDLVYQAIID